MICIVFVVTSLLGSRSWVFIFMGEMNVITDYGRFFHPIVPFFTSHSSSERSDTKMAILRPANQENFFKKKLCLRPVSSSAIPSRETPTSVEETAAFPNVSVLGVLEHCSKTLGVNVANVKHFKIKHSSAVVSWALLAWQETEQHWSLGRDAGTVVCVV